MSEAVPDIGSDSAGRLTRTAADFAHRAHQGQRRKQSGGPYAEHPAAVAALVAEAGLDPKLVTAAHLHDVIEKTSVTRAELESRFGDEIASLVAALSEDDGIPYYAERKRALRDQVLDSGWDATVIYTADRLANLRDWRALPPERRPPVARDLGTTFDIRLKLWREDFVALSRLEGPLPFLTEMEIELRSLTAPAASATPA
jgi:(p)ppGpp synthase/HD superfamily hydrolase